MRRPRLPLEHLIRVTREAFTAARQDPGCDPRCHDVRLAHLLEIERQVISRLKRPRARKARLLGESIMRMSLQSVASSRRADKPLRVLIYGNAGIGKSTLGASAPSPIFLCAEDGVSHLDVPRFPAPETWKDVFDAIKVLTHEDHNYKTLVIDTLDWLEPLCWQHVCKAAGKPDIESFGYGKGYVAAVDAWRLLLGRLELLQSKRGMHLVLLGHAVARDHRDPELDAWKRWSPKLHQASADLICEWCDGVFYATHLAFAKKDGPKVRGVSTGERVLHTEWTAGHVAKNRWAMPSVLPLAWGEVFARTRDLGAIKADAAKLLDQLPADKRAAAAAAVAEAGDDPVKLSGVCARMKKTLNAN